MLRDGSLPVLVLSCINLIIRLLDDDYELMIMVHTLCHFVLTCNKYFVIFYDFKIILHKKG